MGEILRETVSALEKEESSEEAQAQLDIWKYIFGFVEPAVVKCAIELGIAEAIENNGGPMTLSEISSTLGTSTSHGYSYAQTPLSRRLMRNDKQSMAALILLESSPVMLAPWHNLSACVSVNSDFPFENTHAQDLWQYTAANPDHSNLFNDAMACEANLTVPAIIEGYSEAFDGINSLVDVGGGNGTAMSIVVKACSWIRAINFDLQHVIDKAPEIERVEHVAGDMFVQVPKADAAFIMNVLHDWRDEECIQILKKCRESIPKENGRVIIVELVIEEEGNHDKLKDIRLMFDMVMMAHTNFGKERTLKEWDHVIKMAGFSTYIVKSIKNNVNFVIVAFP
ncbi:hypothetical protein TanjilG_04812 [Lupinus angustifolius]|uniref:O-methyltransferase domain-containing protein n=1 Tax=Lupinus angustifolius TaxID=3871 RepID=A0A4P1QS34_LUPAN|nr:hypothetical protein TanjilG_04812 [Lupinus angustifolius]